MGLSTILQEKQPAFHFAKQLYGHGLVTFTKYGQPVWVDRCEFLYICQQVKLEKFGSLFG